MQRVDLAKSRQETDPEFGCDGSPDTPRGGDFLPCLPTAGQSGLPPRPLVPQPCALQTVSQMELEATAPIVETPLRAELDLAASPHVLHCFEKLPCKDAARTAAVGAAAGLSDEVVDALKVASALLRHKHRRALTDFLESIAAPPVARADVGVGTDDAPAMSQDAFFVVEEPTGLDAGEDIAKVQELVPMHDEEWLHMSVPSTMDTTCGSTVKESVSSDVLEMFRELERLELALVEQKHKNVSLLEEKESSEAAHKRDVELLESMIMQMEASNTVGKSDGHDKVLSNGVDSFIIPPSKGKSPDSPASRSTSPTLPGTPLLEEEPHQPEIERFDSLDNEAVMLSLVNI